MRNATSTWTSFILVVLGFAAAPLRAEDRPAAAPPAPPVLTWHADYSTAKKLAQESSRQLLVVFFDAAERERFEAFRDALAADAELAPKLAADYHLAWLPHDYEVSIDGERQPLLRHEAFREMLGRPGLAIIDYRDADAPQHGYVTSVLPLGKEGAKYRGDSKSEAPWVAPRAELSVLLDLPPGTLTQRTLIFAVRTHPDRPASTSGDFHPVLATESEEHAKHQANLRVQGHHGWETRFHRINDKLPTGLVAIEVCAESWSGQGLLEAARECVHSWRQSSGHWNAVRERHRVYGYDMKRGSNGTWYATGIFGRGR